MTVGIEDGGGRFAIVERVREVAIPNGAENGTDKEGNGAGEDLEWKGLAEAIEWVSIRCLDQVVLLWVLAN